MDSVAQAMRDLLEICIWTEFCKLSEANAKRFSDDTARDTRDLTEFVQAVYTSVNQAPESNRVALIDDLKSGTHSSITPQASWEDRSVMASFYKVASKFAHPTASSFM